MPNHLHVLLYPTHPVKSLNQLVGEGKRFIAYEIVKGLEQHGKSSLLEKLRNGVRAKERIKGKKHQVFRLSFDARRCFNEKMLEQKLSYIHHNPVKGKWSLVDDYVNYPYSSANYYETGKLGPVAITHYKELGKD
ncbi:MAG: hypothetical protein BGO68_00905 [Candidatus Amoebophilus sp. 36-38]|nr:MAG: hypothetical protein BGO68_00900 [Candidatus Amoebophilus sp. 36-38]OJW72079.1 MAG: hypothetical protein BGO68_00905 [Candidatus Amoebophilus sp. 36-38]